MKLATYRDGSRDGQLVVVSRDLGLAQYASNIANRLQQVLDDWNYLSPQLQDVYDTLNAGRSRNAFPFDPAQCMAPLPRAYQWVDSAAFAHHVERMHQARGAELPQAFYTEPQMSQGASDNLLGPQDPLVCGSQAFGIDFEAGLAVVTSDIPMGCPADRALEGVRLLMLVNNIRLRHLVADGAPDTVNSRPATAFAAVAVTPDELGEAWSRGRVHLPLQCTWNGRKVGMCDAGSEMGFHFGQLIAHLARTRSVRAGSIVGSGAVSNKGIEKKSGTTWPHGYGCIADKRAMETLQDGKASTEYLQYGDTIRLEMKASNGHSVFGAIEQEVVPPKASNRGRPPGSTASHADAPESTDSNDTFSTEAANPATPDQSPTDTPTP